MSTNESQFRDEITVPTTAIDANGHVNNVVFVQWMQDVAIRHFDKVVGVDATRAAGGAWVVRSHQVEYLSPAFVGERLQVVTWIANYSRVRSLRHYQFLRAPDQKLLVRGETDWVFVNLQTGRPCSIPEFIREAFAKLVTDQKP